MRLAIDPAKLATRLDEGVLEKLLPDPLHRAAVRGATAELGISAAMEGQTIEQWVRTMDWSNVHVLVVLGLGSGVVVDLVRERTTAPILVLEPRASVVSAALAARPMSHDRVHVHGSVLSLRAELRSYSTFGLKLVLLAPPWAQRELAEHVGPLRHAIDEAHRTAVVNDNTSSKFNQEWVDSFLEGLPRLAGHVPVNRMPRGLEGAPGIVVGAGPSLDKNVSFLRGLQGRAAICAVNTSLGALDRAEVRPDMLAIVEFQDLMSQMESSPALPDLALMPGTHAYPGVFELAVRSILPALHRTGAFGTWLCRELDLDALRIGGSVSCLAFSILRHLGCDPIILVGQDCALSAERSHAAGTAYDDIQVEHQPDGAVQLVQKGKNYGPASLTHEVAGWGGGVVKTTQPLDVFRQWFEDIAVSAASETRLVNATEGGAHIEGFEELTLAEVVEQLPSEGVDVAARLDAASSASEPISGANLATALRKEEAACLEVAKLAREAGRSAGRLFGRVRRGQRGSDASSQELDKLERLEAKIRRLTPQTQILDSYVAADLHQIKRSAVSEAEKDPENALRTSLERSRQVFEQIDSTATSLGPRLGRVAAELDT